jgi:hypothetical protein
MDTSTPSPNLSAALPSPWDSNTPVGFPPTRDTVGAGRLALVAP